MAKFPNFQPDIFFEELGKTFDVVFVADRNDLKEILDYSENNPEKKILIYGCPRNCYTSGSLLGNLIGNLLSSDPEVTFGFVNIFSASRYKSCAKEIVYDLPIAKFPSKHYMVYNEGATTLALKCNNVVIIPPIYYYIYHASSTKSLINEYYNKYVFSTNTSSSKELFDITHQLSLKGAKHIEKIIVYENLDLNCYAQAFRQSLEGQIKEMELRIQEMVNNFTSEISKIKRDAYKEILPKIMTLYGTFLKEGYVYTEYVEESDKLRFVKDIGIIAEEAIDGVGRRYKIKTQDYWARGIIIHVSVSDPTKWTAWASSRNHPHIDENGKICIGELQGTNILKTLPNLENSLKIINMDSAYFDIGSEYLEPIINTEETHVWGEAWEGFPRCTFCERALDRDEETRYTPQGEVCCEECFYDNYMYCYGCDRIVHINDVYTAFDEYYCESCFYERFEYCSVCGELIDKEDDIYHLVVDDEWYCERCYNDRFVECEECGEVITKEGANWIEDEAYCDSCFEEIFTKCVECDKVIRKDDADCVDGLWYCEDCFEEIFTTCESCHVPIRRNEDNFRDSVWLCEECYQRLRVEEETNNTVALLH